MAQELTLAGYLDSPKIKMGLENTLGKRAQQFKSALLNIYSSNKLLRDCDPCSIVGAAVCAVINNLSITPSLGQAYIVPFKGKAQFQIGTRGLIQLAHRTGQYVALHAGKVYEGEIKSLNPITGEPEHGEKISDNVVGYVAYMRLATGFEKTLYMTLEEIEEHALQYSQSYAYDKKYGKKSSPWTNHFDAMASKTVLKRLLNKWGILSTEMASVIQADQSVVDKNTFTYIDNGGNSQLRDIIYSHDEELDIDEVTDDETTAAPNTENA